MFNYPRTKSMKFIKYTNENFDFDMFKFYSVLAYLVFSFSYVSILGELTTIVSLFNYLFYILFFVIFLYELFKLKYEFNFYNILFSLFLISTIITMYLNSYSFAEYLNEFKLILLGIFQFFIFFNSFNLNKEKKLKIVSCVVLAISLISHISSIIIYIFRVRIKLNKVYGIQFNGSFTGIYDNENILGIICFVGIVFSFIFLNYFKGIVFKQISIINFVLSTIMLFLVNARSAVMAFLVFCFVFTAILFKNKWIIIIGAISGGFLGLYFFVFNKPILMRMLNGRYEIWEQVLFVVKEKFLFGYSKTDSINELISSTIRFLSGAKEGGTHNTFLDILISYGAIALLLFVVFIFIYLIKTYKNLIKNLSNFNYIIMYSTVLSFIFIGFFESVLVYTPSLIGVIFWMLLSYVKSKSKIENLQEI